MPVANFKLLFCNIRDTLAAILYHLGLNLEINQVLRFCTLNLETEFSYLIKNCVGKESGIFLSLANMMQITDVATTESLKCIAGYSAKIYVKYPHLAQEASKCMATS